MIAGAGNGLADCETCGGWGSLEGSEKAIGGSEVEACPECWPYVWVWKPSAHRPMDGVDRRGPCRVLARGKMNSAKVVWPNGYWSITSRNGLRRR